MSERTEKKVDLILKILLNLKVKHIGHLYNRKYIDGYIDELIPVYNLFAEKDVINNFPPEEKIQNWENKLNNDLNKLKQDYERGDFLVRDQNIVKTRIKDLTSKLEHLVKLSKNKEKFEEKSVELYRINLFMDLQKKLEITEEYDSYGYRRLDREKNNLKDNIQGLIEELQDYLDNNNKKEEL